MVLHIRDNRAMKCIYCGGDTEVTNSRPQKRTNAIWRRRLCKNCGNIFTTHELADFSGSWAFLDKNGHIQPFVQEKLFISLYDALRHRDTALNDASALTGTVLNKLLKGISHATIEREQLIVVTAEVLNNFDSVAAVSYRAFHKL